VVAVGCGDVRVAVQAQQADGPDLGQISASRPGWPTASSALTEVAGEWFSCGDCVSSVLGLGGAAEAGGANELAMDQPVRALYPTALSGKVPEPMPPRATHDHGRASISGTSPFQLWEEVIRF